MRILLAVMIVVVVLVSGCTPDYERDALSWGFTPQGAKSYAQACQTKWVSVQEWARIHPEDVDPEAGDASNDVHCIARHAIEEAEKAAKAEYEAKVTEIRDRVLWCDKFTKEEEDLYGDEIAQARLDRDLRKEREKAEWDATHPAFPDGYEPPDSTGP